ncbi:hypothetical protein D3C72_2493730 [compost metagenome]
MPLDSEAQGFIELGSAIGMRRTVPGRIVRRHLDEFRQHPHLVVAMRPDVIQQALRTEAGTFCDGVRFH